MKKFTLLIGLFFATQTWGQICAPAVSYMQDFESAAVPDMPGCTTIINAGTGNNWVTVDNPGSGFTSKTLHYTGNDSNADAWFFTRPILMSAGTFYKISYRYGNNSDTTVESLIITRGTEATVAAAEVFAFHDNITGGTPITQLIQLYSAPTSGMIYFGFNAKSTANQGSLYVDDIVIEKAVCGTPTDIQISNVSSNGATVSWSPPTGSNIDIFSVYQYAYSTTNMPPADGTYYSDTSVDLTELEPNTTYYVFNRSLCGPVWSDWTSGLAFTTPSCAAAETPYVQGFTSATVPGMPLCTTAPEAISGSNWITVNNPGNGFENETLQYTANGEAANAWFFTQGVNLTGGTFYKFSYTYGNNSATKTDKLKFGFATSPNAASFMGPVAEHEVITGGTPTAYSSGPISVATGTYYFGFNAYSDANQGNIYVDNIKIEEWTCEEPQNLSVKDVTDDSATISWTAPEGSNAFGYLYAMSTESTPPVIGDFTNDLSINYNDLESSTTYYVFVKSQCGPVTGEWTAIQFSTPDCGPADLPYSQNFEAAFVPKLPPCTTTKQLEAGNDWATASSPGNGFTTKVLQYMDGGATAQAWFFTPGLELTAGTRYKISYKYGNNSATAIQKLKVTFGTSPNSTSVTGFLNDHEDITGGVPVTSVNDFVTVPVSGIYYFGFNVHSAGGNGNLYLDDILIEEQVCGKPHNVTISDVTTTTATINWNIPETGNSTADVYQYAYSTTDIPPAEGTFEDELSVNISELIPETTYYVFTRTKCGPLWSDWTVTTFTTEEILGIGDNKFKGLTVHPNPVKDALNINASNIIDKIEVYNITGQLILIQNIGSQNGSVNLQQLAAGAYLISITAEGATKRIKIIKE